RCEKILDRHIAHTKTSGRQINRAITNGRDELVIASTAGERSGFALAIKDFEYKPGVIIEAADHREVDFDKVLQTAPAQFAEQRLKIAQLGDRLTEKASNLCDAQAELLQLCLCIGLRFAFDLVDDCQNLGQAVFRHAF